MKQIKDLKKGEYFKLKDSETATIYVRGEYERSKKKYSCHKFDNICAERFFKGNTKVFTDFEF